MASLRHLVPPHVDRYVTTEFGSEAKRNKFEDYFWSTLVCASPTTGVNLESQLQKKVERLPSNTQMLRSIAQRHASAIIKISERPSSGIWSATKHLLEAPRPDNKPLRFQGMRVESESPT